MKHFTFNTSTVVAGNSSTDQAEYIPLEPKEDEIKLPVVVEVQDDCTSKFKREVLRFDDDTTLPLDDWVPKKLSDTAPSSTNEKDSSGGYASHQQQINDGNDDESLDSKVGHPTKMNSFQHFTNRFNQKLPAKSFRKRAPAAVLSTSRRSQQQQINHTKSSALRNYRTNNKLPSRASHSHQKVDNSSVEFNSNAQTNGKHESSRQLFRYYLIGFQGALKMIKNQKQKNSKKAKIFPKLRTFVNQRKF